LVGRKLQCQTQQRDGVQPATSELPGCRSAWTTGRMDRGWMTGRMTGRTDSGEASFLIPTSFTYIGFSSNDQQRDFRHLWQNILDFFGGFAKHCKTFTHTKTR